MLPLCVLCAALLADPEPTTLEADWGKITGVERAAGDFLIQRTGKAPLRQLPLPEKLPTIVGLPAENRTDRAIQLVLDPEGKEATLAFPDQQDASVAESSRIVTTAVGSRQRPDGLILFDAGDAEISGKVARLESQLKNRRIGFWTNLDDSVSWKYRPTRPGRYSVELTYSLADGNGSEMEVTVDATKLSRQIEPTGSWYRYRTVSLGNVAIGAQDTIPIVVRCLEKTGSAALNLKSLILRPISEGEPIVQADDGSITCHARDVRIQGVKVQYEPKPEKNTVGYWVNPEDQIAWDFEIQRPGAFAVEILQGCGTGQGGSNVEMVIDREALRFIVEDTGHFQNFKPRAIGKVRIAAPGRHTLTVRPIRKPGVAVMDLRQVRLMPVTD